MIGLARIGQRRSSQRNLQEAQHVVETTHPVKPVALLGHGQMKRDAQKHFLRRLQQLPAT